jgi:hypothetical protein
VPSSRSQIKQAAPIKDSVIKQFCTEEYFRFLSRPRDHAAWDRLDEMVRDGVGSASEQSELEQCGIMVRHCFDVFCFYFKPPAHTLSPETFPSLELRTHKGIDCKYVTRSRFSVLPSDLCMKAKHERCSHIFILDA